MICFPDRTFNSVTCVPPVLHFKDARDTPFHLLLGFALLTLDLLICSFRVRNTKYHIQEVCTVMDWYLGRQTLSTFLSFQAWNSTLRLGSGNWMGKRGRKRSCFFNHIEVRLSGWILHFQSVIKLGHDSQYCKEYVNIWIVYFRVLSLQSYHNLT